MRIKILLGKALLWLQSKCRSCVEAAMNDKLRKAGSDGRVVYGVDVRHIENVHIGKGSYVNGGMLAASEEACISIGENCMISYAVHMRTDKHRHSDVGAPMCEQGHDYEDIIIGDDVWIGYGAQIMSGVTIGSHSIIGAGAVVTHDIPQYSVAVGVPARVIKDRAESYGC